MNIQVFGTKKCNDTKKALRFFKERNIKIHFIDLTEKAISKGELNNILRTISEDDLINKQGKEYKKMNLHYLQHNIQNVLLENPLLFSTPIVRNGGDATVGNSPDKWKQWIKDAI